MEIYEVVKLIACNDIIYRLGTLFVLREHPSLIIVEHIGTGDTYIVTEEEWENNFAYLRMLDL